MLKITIITVNFNNLKGLQKTIKSVLCQNYTNIEYIIIDGDSTDGSKEFIMGYQDKFYYWCSEKDQGIYDGMNKGIAKATGDYLLFLNSGDYFIKNDSLKKLLKSINNEDLIVCRQKFISEQGKKTSSPKLYAYEIDIKFFLSSTFPHQSTLINRKLFDKIGLYDISYKTSADWVFWVKAIIEYKCTIKFLPLFITYMEDGGISRNMNKCHIDMGRLLDDYKNRGLIKWNDIFDVAIKARKQDYCERYTITAYISKICAWIGKHI